MGVKNDGPGQTPSKKLLYYYGIVLLITLLLNALVVPMMVERKVTEVPFNQFLQMVNDGGGRKSCAGRRSDHVSGEALGWRERGSDLQDR